MTTTTTNKTHLPINQEKRFTLSAEITEKIHNPPKCFGKIHNLEKNKNCQKCAFKDLCTEYRMLLYNIRNSTIEYSYTTETLKRLQRDDAH